MRIAFSTSIVAAILLGSAGIILGSLQIVRAEDVACSSRVTITDPEKGETKTVDKKEFLTEQCEDDTKYTVGVTVKNNCPEVHIEKSTLLPVMTVQRPGEVSFKIKSTVPGGNDVQVNTKCTQGQSLSSTLNSKPETQAGLLGASPEGAVKYRDLKDAIKNKDAVAARDILTRLDKTTSDYFNDAFTGPKSAQALAEAESSQRDLAILAQTAQADTKGVIKAEEVTKQTRAIRGDEFSKLSENVARIMPETDEGLKKMPGWLGGNQSAAGNDNDPGTPGGGVGGTFTGSGKSLPPGALGQKAGADAKDSDLGNTSTGWWQKTKDFFNDPWGTAIGQPNPDAYKEGFFGKQPEDTGKTLSVEEATKKVEAAKAAYESCSWYNPFCSAGIEKVKLEAAEASLVTAREATTKTPAETPPTTFEEADARATAKDAAANEAEYKASTLLEKGDEGYRQALLDAEKAHKESVTAAEAATKLAPADQKENAEAGVQESKDRLKAFQDENAKALGAAKATKNEPLAGPGEEKEEKMVKTVPPSVMEDAAAREREREEALKKYNEKAARIGTSLEKYNRAVAEQLGCRGQEECDAAIAKVKAAREEMEKAADDLRKQLPGAAKSVLAADEEKIAALRKRLTEAVAEAERRREQGADNPYRGNPYSPTNPYGKGNNDLMRALFGGGNTNPYGNLSPQDMQMLQYQCYTLRNQQACAMLQQAQQQDKGLLGNLMDMFKGKQQPGAGNGTDPAMNQAMCGQYPGTQYIGNSCQCPNGQQWTGQGCQSQQNMCTQYPGTTLVNGRCTCPTGQQWDGKQCGTGTGGPTIPEELSAELSCAPQVVDEAETPIAISWTCRGASTSRGDGFSTDGQTSGSVEIKMSASNLENSNGQKDLVLTCIKEGRTVVDQCPITANAAFIVAVASPSEVNAGETTHIGWIVKGMAAGDDICKITSDKHPGFSETGRNKVITTPPITQNTIFTIECRTNANGTKKAEVPVKIKGGAAAVTS